jgi:hypothetical protein
MSTELARLRAVYEPLDAPVPAATLARLDALIAAADRPTSAPRRSGRRRARALAPHRRGPLARPRGRAPALAPRRRRALLLATGLAVVLVAAVALLPGRSHAPQPATARAACAPRGVAAARCAQALGVLAAGRSLPGVGDVLYRRGSYVVTAVTITAHPRPGSHFGPGRNIVRVAAARTPFTVVSEAREELWLAPDGSGRFAHGDGGPARPQTAADAAAWRAAGSPDLAKLAPAARTERPLAFDVKADAAGDALLGAGGLYDFLPHGGDPLAPIPHAPAALTAWLRERAFKERAGKQDPGCRLDGRGCKRGTLRLMADVEVEDIESLLAYPATPPDLRATLVRVLGARPGARSLGLIRDGAGREVAAIAVADVADGAPVIAFDPDTGELRGVAARGAGGELRWLRTYAVQAARVAAVGDRPRVR